MTEKKATKIDPEFSSLIPPISDDEFKELETSIKKEGCRDALVVYKGSILDGHSRYKICTEHGIDFKLVNVKGVNNRDEAKLWVIRNQLARRNLTTWQKAQMALKLKSLIEKKAKEKQREAGGAVPKKSDKPPVDTLQVLSKVGGVSRDTINKVEQIHKLIEKGLIPESIKINLETGKSSIHEVWKKHAKKEMPKTQMELVGINESKTISELITKIGAKARSLTSDFHYLNGSLHQLNIKKDDTRFWNAKFFQSLMYLYLVLEEFRTGEEIEEQEIMDRWKKWLHEPSEETPPKKQFKENKK